MLEKVSSLSVDPAYWLGKILPYVPTPGNSSRRGKILFSSILALIFLFLCVPLKSVKNPYAEGMLAFSPAQQAREIYDMGGPKEAWDYIVFYQGLPNVKRDAELEKIKAVAEAHRGSWTYRAEELGRGAIGANTHEEYSTKFKGAVSFVPGLAEVGNLMADGQNIYGHWRKFKNDESVNTFLLALDGAGLVLDIAGFVPANKIVTKPAKKAMTPIRNAWAKISPEVKNYIFNLFKPVFAAIAQSNLMEFKRSDLANPASFYESKKNQFNQVVALTKTALGNLGPILALSAKSEPIAEVVMLNSQTPQELEINLELANRFTKEDMPILKFGGAEALRAAARLKERGELDPQVLKAAMSYGPAGLNAVGHMSAADIIKGDFSPRRAYSWLQILLLVLYIPYTCLAMIKIWRPELAHPASVKEA